MKRQHLVNGIPIICLAAFAIQCDDHILSSITSDREDTGVVYSTSFEQDADTSAWKGYGYGLKNEAAPEGGKRSMMVSGGCIWPHGLLRLRPLQHDSRLIIRCWGKNLGIGGGMSLRVDGNSGAEIHINVQDTAWTAYQSADTLFCPAGNQLSLTVGAGGYVFSAMLIDLIEIRRVP